MNQQKNMPTHQDALVSDDNDDEIDLLGLIQTLGEEKKLLLFLPFICACVAAVISLYITPMYTATATFIVPDRQSSSASAVLEQLGGITGNFIKSPTEMYIALMQSNTVLDEIISELDLIQKYQTKTQEEARKKLLSVVKITTDKKSGLIMIVAQDPSPDMAAKLANAYSKPFRAILKRISLEEAHHRKNFFSQQIDIIALRPFRDPFVQSTLMNSMIKQYESARIDEVRDTQILFPVDVAKSPENRTSPKRRKLVIIVGFAAFSLTLVFIFIKRALRHLHSNPASSRKWAMMKKAWKIG